MDDDMTSEEFTQVANSVCMSCIQVFRGTMEINANGAFCERPAAARNIAPLVSGAMEALLRLSMSEREEHDDVFLRDRLIELIDERMPLIRFNIIAHQAQAVGEGRA